MRVVLMGAGHIGHTIASLLSGCGDYQVKVVDRSADALKPLRQLPLQTEVLDMYLKNPTSEGFTFLNQQQHTPGALSFIINPPGTGWPPSGHVDLGGTRILRVDTAIKLANNKFLDFNTSGNSRSIEMYSSGVPDKGKFCDPGDQDCQEENVPGLYLPSLLQWNDGQGRQNWLCRTFGVFCRNWP